MLYHPLSPFYQQFLSAAGRGPRARATDAVQAKPAANASAAQARAANAEK